MELQDDNGDDLKLPLLGMSRESDWILFPAHTDKTMVRDVSIGNVVGLVTGTAGAVSGRYEYTPFGNELRVTGTAAKSNPIRFSTQFADDINGTSKYLHRDLSGSQGRWLSRDPIGERGGPSLYGFVMNDPVNGIDKLGTARVVVTRDSVVFGGPGESCRFFAQFSWEQESEGYVDVRYTPLPPATEGGCVADVQQEAGGLNYMDFGGIRVTSVEHVGQEAGDRPLEGLEKCSPQGGLEASDGNCLYRPGLITWFDFNFTHLVTCTCQCGNVTHTEQFHVELSMP